MTNCHRFRSISWDAGQLHPKCTRFQTLEEKLDRLNGYYERLTEYSNNSGRWLIDFLTEWEITDYMDDISKYKVYGDEINKFLNQTKRL